MELIYNKEDTLKIGDVEKSESRGWFASVYEYFGTHDDEFKISLESWWPTKRQAIACVKREFKNYNTIFKS